MSFDGAPVLWEVSKGGHGGQHFVPETKRFKPCWKKTLQTSPSLQGFHWHFVSVAICWGTKLSPWTCVPRPSCESCAFPWAGWCTSLTPLQTLPQLFPCQISTSGSSQLQTKPTVRFMPSPRTLDPLLHFIRQVWNDQESKMYYSRLIWHVCKGQSVWTMENIVFVFFFAWNSLDQKSDAMLQRLSQFPFSPR